MGKINKINVENVVYDIEDKEIKSWARQDEKPTYDYTEIQNTPDLSKYIDKDVNNLTNYELKISTANNILVSINSDTYVMTISLRNSNNDVLNTQTIDLPLETMVVSGAYDDTTKEIVLTLKNLETIRFSVADLVSGLQSEITATNKLSADLVDDTDSTNKFTNASEKAQWTAKYDKPSTGIPKTDLAQAVQDSLNLADSAIQDITGKEDKTNKVTSLDSTSTDTQYPSAKSVWDLISGLSGDGVDVNYIMTSASEPFLLYQAKKGIYINSSVNENFYLYHRTMASTPTAEYEPCLCLILFQNADISVSSTTIIGTYLGFKSTIGENGRRGGEMYWGNVYKYSNNASRLVVPSIFTSYKNALFLTKNEQKFEGLKTFLTIPQQSDTTAPTQDKEFTNKKYVDDLISSMGSGATVGTYTSSYSNLVNMNTLKKGVYYPLGNFGTIFYYQIDENGSRQTINPSNLAQFKELIILKEQSEVTGTETIGYLLSVDKSGIELMQELHYIVNASGEITGMTSGSSRTTNRIYLPSTNFDGTKTQVLKNVNGTIQWVDEE